MKFLVTLMLLPFAGLGQIKLEKISLMENKIEMLAPADLTKMPDEIWTIKYHKKVKPALVLSDENGEVNLIGDVTKLPADEEQIITFKDQQIEQLKKNRPDLRFLEDGVKTINGKKVGFFKFISQAEDQEVFNYYFFTALDGKVLIFTFNCIEKLQKTWEKSADEIVESLKTKDG